MQLFNGKRTAYLFIVKKLATCLANYEWLSSNNDQLLLIVLYKLSFCYRSDVITMQTCIISFTNHGT